MAIAIGTSETVEAPIERSARAYVDRILPYGLIAPGIFVAFAIAIVPMGYAIWLSLQDWYLLRRPTPTWGGLVNYNELFHDASLWAAFGRTWIWTVGTVFVELILGVPIALLLNRESIVSRTASALILLPWVTPFVVLAFGWRFLLDGDVGPIQAFLKVLGISGTGSVLNDPVRALIAITIISGWKGMPFMVIAVLAALKSIPKEIYEAAEVDGAGVLRRFYYVTLPAIWNTLLTVGIVLGILAFYSFDLPWIMTRGGPQDATTIVGISIYKAVFQELRPAYAAAISVVMLVLLFVASILTLRLRRKD
ncbi:MAG TPA: sugar ABC transporter permease [Chthoniobacterales bacterium]|nr:sugar ABC transporter permease [Chthoniobacterales bacterium]